MSTESLRPPDSSAATSPPPAPLDRPPGASRRGAAEVFLSHSSRDEAFVRHLRERLEAAGISCWFAPTAIAGGEEWAAEIAAAIGNARAMVLAHSKAANDSRHVQREVFLAAERGLRVVPVRLEPAVPEGGLAFFLAGVHWIEAGGEKREAALDEVVAAVRREQGGTLLPAPSGLRWRIALEALCVLVLSLLTVRFLLGPDAGEPWLKARWHGPVTMLGTVLGLATFLACRIRGLSRPSAPVLPMLCAYGLALIAFGASWSFQGEVVHTWSPRELHVRNLCNVEDGDPLDDGALASADGPIHIARSGASFRATVIVPPRSWLTEETRDYIEAMEGDSADPRLPACFEDGIHFVQTELKNNEQKSLARVSAVLIALLLTCVAALSVGHAHALNAIERASHSVS